MNNEEKGMKIQVPRSFETFLGVGLQGLLPLNHTEAACSMPPESPDSSLTTFMTLVKLFRFVLPNKFKFCIMP